MKKYVKDLRSIGRRRIMRAEDNASGLTKALNVIRLARLLLRREGLRGKALKAAMHDAIREALG